MVTQKVPIVDRNGILTSRHKRIEGATSTAMRTSVPVASMASPLVAERPITDAHAFAQEVKSRYPGIILHFSGNDYSGYATLDNITVPKELRGQGIAKKVIKELVDEADANGWNMALTPSSDFGSSKARLVKFYSSFGFVPNSGRNKDYTTSETMLRLAAS